MKVTLTLTKGDFGDSDGLMQTLDQLRALAGVSEKQVMSFDVQDGPPAEKFLEKLRSVLYARAEGIEAVIKTVVEDRYPEKFEPARATPMEQAGMAIPLAGLLDRVDDLTEGHAIPDRLRRAFQRD